MRSILQLQNECQRIIYFGLGFIQVVVSDEVRYHFYDDSIKTITDDPHNHRYDFTSEILGGHLVNMRYNILQGYSHQLIQSSCEENVPASTEIREVSIEVAEVEHLYRGNSYEMKHDQLHTVQAIGPTITKLTRGPVVKEYTDVAVRCGKKNVCPFSVKVGEAQLWDKVAEIRGKILV